MTEPRLILDLSRLVSRVLHPTPTGVDRVEMAYARGLLAAAPDRLDFAAVHPTGAYGRLPTEIVGDFLDRTERRWQEQGHQPAAENRRFAVRMLAALRPRPVPRPSGERTVYIQASPHHLTRPRVVDRILRREAARFVCLVHDLIPVEFPEYARPDGAADHRVRIETIVGHADGILGNSAATLDMIRPWVARSGRTPRLAVAHLGTEDHGVHDTRPSAGQRPYFVCVGTIEPRKNHLLLLNIWRRLSNLYGAANIPKLVIIGRRGWENEQIVDMLDRCPALAGCVEEHAGLPDAAMWPLLARARALLMPSFAEGFGMPVTEALSLGVPVLCSDIAALREAGGNAPDYLDPLDGIAWLQAIRNYTGASAARDAQCARMATWHRPNWQNHIAEVLRIADEVAA